MITKNLAKRVYINGTGLFTPSEKISNEELVTTYNKFVDEYLEQHPGAELLKSDAAFIEKASGIKSRFAMNKAGILNTQVMGPQNLERRPDETSLLCEMAVSAAKEALDAAQMTPSDVNAVICACSNMPRPYPSLAVEIQNKLNIQGFAFDLNVACASAVFALQVAYQHVLLNPEQTVLLVNPEICTAHLNFRDRDCHFIFGDAATAMLVSSKSHGKKGVFEILDTKLATSFSNNIRNSFGFLNRTTPELLNPSDLLFKQNGRKVFKDVVGMVSEHLVTHLQKMNLSAQSVRRLWLHQANLSMNQLIAKKVLDRDAIEDDAPIVLDRYANTSSAGSVIAFHLHKDDLQSGNIGILSAFGAGYSVGSAILQRV